MTTSNRSSKAKARKRIASIFTYLQEVDRVRTPPIVDLGEYEWHMRLRDVPAAPSVRWGARLAAFAPPGAQLSEDLVLRVARPPEELCPEPPPVLRAELHRGWDQPDRPARLQTVQPTVVSADASEVRALDARREAFERWLPERERWAAQQRPMSLFLQLYELWTKFERESEKYQIYLGDGMLVREPGADSEASKVRHPVILQRLELRFDPTIPAFFLTESEDAPVLYAPMLRHLDVDGKTLLQLGQRFAEQGLDPLSGGELDAFLQQLVHGLWKDGEYVRDASAPRGAGVTGPRLYRDPVIYLGHRSQDFADAIDRYLEALPGLDELPTALERIVGIEPERKPAKAAPVEPLLTRPANAQQERVIERLAETGAVLVQGPPGTGKTHTIANLIGHLLAQNKTILVTSHASKALRVVRDQVAEPLRSLCVSVLDSDDDSARQLEESITGILNYFSATSKDELVTEVVELAEARRELAARCAQLTEELARATASEYDKLTLDRDQVPIAEVTAEMIAARGQHDWLPGPVHGAEPPLSAAEVTELYGLVARIGPADEKDRDLVVPALERLPGLSEMGELTNARARHDDPTAQDTRGLWRNERQTDAQLAALGDQVTRTARLLAQAAPWTLECLDAAAKGREAARPWRELVDLIKETGTRVPPRMKLVLQHAPEVQSELPLAEQIAVCGEIVAHLRAGKKLGRTLGVFRPAWQAFVKGATVKGKPAETAEHFQALLDSLEIRAAREALTRQWTWLMVPLGAPPPAQLGAAIEQGAQPYVEIIEAALAWELEHLRPTETALEQAGLDLHTIVERSPVPAVRHGRWVQLRALYGETLPALLESRRRWLTWTRLTGEREKWLAYLVELLAGREKDPRLALVAELLHAVNANARDLYARAWGRAERLTGLQPAAARRDALLARLEKAAPAWHKALKERTPPHDQGVPGAKDPEAAWAYRRWAQVLEAATAADLDALQTRLNEATTSLQELTARYVEKLAWAAQFERTGLEQQQALAGWLALHKKIGKGSGKNAARLKEEAKRTLVKCRPAVPVWIMPLARVFESFDLATTRFDVVILDEASQCDILGLPCFAMGKEVAVVGDHEQVSPYAVGHELDKVQALIDELLEDIPNKQLYDGKTSVYDLARQSFGGTIRLLEHFRCVPEIIEFSNQLCYGGEIRPLREAGTARVKPALVAHHCVRGVKEDKVNEEEARELAALVTAVCEAPEYEGCSMGVISMVGTEQAVVIDAMLRRSLPAAEYQRRRLLCGNASQFQGDERDVVFLSLVDSSIPGKRLPVSRRDETRKVFNVAASRARDQLWVVHSLDPDRDLKDGDLRLALLSYARNPQAADAPGAAGVGAAGVGAAGAKRKAPSTFSKELADALRSREYTPVLQWPIGNYLLDIAIEGAGGHRVAIQCDGGAEDSPVARAAAVERQITLERIGWRFVRVRASAFALRPRETVDRIAARLAELGIQPGGPSLAPRVEGRLDSLKQRILARAAQLRGGSRATLRAVSNAEG